MSSRLRRSIRCRPLLISGLSLLSASVTAQVAQAQASSSNIAMATPVNNAEGLTDIVVTASRREELAKDVPVAVTVVSGEKLNVLNSSGLDIRFLSGRVPSLLVESSFGRTFPRFYIRGLGNTDFDPNAAQPVSVVYDDVALESPMLKSYPVFDLQNVQVLRGPQGTLFGRNTPAGVIKLDSVRPSDEFNGYGSVSWGTYNTVNAEGAVGGPIGDGFTFRASGLLQRRDNWVKNDDTTGLADHKLEGYRDLAGRVQLGYESGDFHALINVHGRDLDGTPRVFRAGIIQQGSNNFVAGFDKDHVALDGLTHQRLSQWGSNLHLDYKFDGIGTLYSVTGYERARVNSIGDIDGGDIYSFPPVGLNVGLFPSNTGGVTKPKEVSQEVRFASEEFNGFRVQVGANYFHQKLRYDELSYSGTTVSTQDLIHDDTNENIGLFGSLEYKATDALTLRAGVRYSHDKRHDIVEGFGPVTDGLVLPLQARVKGSNVSWDASATYALSPSVNVYTRAATGYLGPAIQDRVTFGSVQSTAKKQTTISGEAGLKAALIDRTLTFDLTGYWNRTKNLQLTAVGGASNSARLLNADHAIGYGVEADLEANPVDHLVITLGGSWNFTEIRDKNVAVGVCGSGQCTVTDPLDAAGLAIINGNDLPQAPRFIANTTVRYGIPLANGNEIFAFTDWAFRSKVNYFLYTAKEFRGRSMTEGGIKVGYRMSNGIEASVFARNVLNQIRIVSAIDFNNLTGMISEPRIIGVELRGSF